jgi:hypothetical protein
MVASSRQGMRQPLNPPQTAQLLGGSPPGMAPPNAFDLDPAELDRMLASGWTMYDDGTMAPPPTAGQMPTPGGGEYGAGGYATAGPTDGTGPMLGGNSAPAPQLPPGAGGDPFLPGPQQAPLPGMGGGSSAPPLPDLGLGNVAGGLGVPPLAGPPGPDMGVSAAPGQPVPLGGGGLFDGPLGLAQDPSVSGLLPPATPPGGAPPPIIPAPQVGLPGNAGGGPPPLDPFAYTADQNARSLAPSRGDSVGADPGGYVGGDVARFDPTKLLPARRRGDRNGSPARLNTPDPSMANSFQPRPRRRP